MKTMVVKIVKYNKKGSLYRDEQQWNKRNYNNIRAYLKREVSDSKYSFL